MIKELQDFGLSDKEARVYLAALEIGRATADQLAKHAKIVRSTTYVQLESLMKKGLMSTYEEGKKTYFTPESPEYLKRTFELKRQEFDAKEKELGALLPGLVQMFASAGDKPIVRFFAGKEGIASMREGFLQLPSGTELKLIYAHDALERVFSEEERTAYAKKRAAKGIFIKAVYTRQDKPLLSTDIVSNTERRFIPFEKMPISSDIYVYDSTVAIMALRKKIFGVVIESEEIAQSMNALFSLLWDIGQEG